jgi:hypothetical protein
LRNVRWPVTVTSAVSASGSTAFTTVDLSAVVAICFVT